MNRRKLLRTVTASTAALTTTSLSGCLGFLDGENTETPTKNTSTNTNTANDGTKTTSVMTENNIGAEDSEGIPAYNWTQGESYKYRLSFDENTYISTWTAIEAEKDNLTMEVKEKLEGEGWSKTAEISGTNRNIYKKIRENQSIDGLLLQMRGSLRYVVDRELSVGDTYKYEVEIDADFDTENVEVLSETTINGIPCYELQITIPGYDYVRTIAVEKGNNYPLIINGEFTDSENSQTNELIEATRP